VLVPDEPVDLPLNLPLEMSVVAVNRSSGVPAALDKLAALAQNHPAQGAQRKDVAAQHDHYLYGMPKRP
jgi:hypothetical protein